MTSPPHETAAALLRRQQSKTARLRAGLPALLQQLEALEEPVVDDLLADPRTPARTTGPAGHHRSGPDRSRDPGAPEPGTDS